MQRTTFTIGLQRASHPLFCNYYVRLGTFMINFTLRLKTRHQLAEAGFFYKDDKVQCFHCGLNLMNWRDVENPWEEHARHSERCIYLLRIKGDNYLQIVRQRFRDIAVRQQSGNETATIDLAVPGPSSQNPQDVIDKIPTSTPATKDENVSDSDDIASSKSFGGLECLICFERKRDIFFIPCQHVATCAECAKKLNNVCPICYDTIILKFPVNII